jgi:cob(I)alamin adenosyltransferase
MIQVYTGDGKGKTTAAFGLALRAAGAGKLVEIVQFGKIMPSSEGQYGLKLGLFNIRAFWEEGFLRPGDDIEPFRKKTLDGIDYVRSIIGQRPIDLLILDEIIVVHKLGTITDDELKDVIDIVPKSTELILTGRGAPNWLIERADLVTEMRKVKHYYDNEVQAREGIEF